MKSRLLELFTVILLLFLSFFVPSGASEESGRRLMFNVRDFGALGNGQTKDTAAIQQALDRCSVLGGCEVLVPPGDYLTGAAAIPAPQLPEPVPAPAQPYRLR